MPEVSDEQRSLARLSAEQLAHSVVFSTQWLGVHVDEINALNVYPVPDGDTGTNMHLTMQSVRRQLSDGTPHDFVTLAHALAYGSLLGARGNSGVILSQVLKGIAESIKGKDSLASSDVAEALVSGAASAYAAVMKPVEGTILTVVREAAEAANNARAGLDPLALLEVALEAGQESLARTPELLPILKQAGVVDAGGLGFLRLLEGIIAYFQNRDLPPPPKVESRAQQQFEEAEFGFCTEFLLSDVTVPTSEIQELVAPYGDSLLVVGAEGFVKGHIHTEEPEKLLAEVSRFGRMVRSKVEDMSEQHSEILADVELGADDAPEVAVVGVASGYGLTRVMRSLGVRVVGGGQTDNPSVQDLADAVRSVGAKSIIVMPNNKNVIMAAERVVELVTDRDVRVLPTTTLGQGLAAAVALNSELDADELVEEMSEAARGATTLEVTTASRGASIGGVEVAEGNAIGLIDNELKVSAADPETALFEVLAATATEADVATLFYNSEIDAEGAAALAARIIERYAHLEVEVHPGGPELYSFLVVLE